MSQEEAKPLSQAERERFANGAKQVVGYTNFLRWCANFRRNEVTAHPNHDQVLLLSPMQSSRFSFAIEGNTLLLGVQWHEACWMAAMPFEYATVSDRLYLSVSGREMVSQKLPPLTIGFFVNDPQKRAMMAQCQFLQTTRVTVQDGRVVEIGRAFGLGFPIEQGDIIARLALRDQQLRQKSDIMSRFL